MSWLLGMLYADRSFVGWHRTCARCVDPRSYRGKGPDSAVRSVCAQECGLHAEDEAVVRCLPPSASSVRDKCVASGRANGHGVGLGA